MKFHVVVQDRGGQHPVYLVCNREDRDRPVAQFDDLAAAEAHADRLNAGPLDWDEQEAWQDDW